MTELSLAPLEDKSGEIIVAIMFGEGKHISGGELGMLYHSGTEFHLLRASAFSSIFSFVWT